MKKIAGAALAALLVLAPPAWATDDPVSGTDFLEACDSKGFAQGWCTGFVQGIAEWMIEDGFAGAIKACVPRSVSVIQLREVAVKFAREHPEMWHQPPRYMIATSIVRTFPCE
ncbi:hypothetical protein JL101_036435 (plasmid) [Skermanella rosea]|uniref:Rap1a/Tai family immunity protein n=1 Tax=Skermanella rosea TaxID=1817965 RepID=UPI0019334F89|nr:Rap1a/Tai family immunity protein [Skermanella rosea]UEM08232.1 hypothetical protein JL101_036435 [Skermanella rosea]